MFFLCYYLAAIILVFIPKKEVKYFHPIMGLSLILIVLAKLNTDHEMDAAMPLIISSAILGIININKYGFIVFALGGLSNRMVMALNNNFMPVSIEAARRYFDKLPAIHPTGELVTNPGYRYIENGTIAPFLGDWIYFPYLGGIVSPGDVMILFGMILLIHQVKR